MTIAEAMRLVTEEYNADCLEAQANPKLGLELGNVVAAEYAEIDQELPGYCAEIALAAGVARGTTLPGYVYQMARMVFRLGMRVQRKIERPEEPTTIYWRAAGGPQA